jgi:hypothetical protein
MLSKLEFLVTYRLGFGHLNRQTKVLKKILELSCFDLFYFTTYFGRILAISKNLSQRDEF